VFLGVVTDSLRRNARNRPRVLAELFRMLENAAIVGTPPARRALLAERVRAIMDDVEQMERFDGNSERDMRWIRSHAERAIKATETGRLAT
jgi:hypothetical protein